MKIKCREIKQSEENRQSAVFNHHIKHEHIPSNRRIMLRKIIIINKIKYAADGLFSFPLYNMLSIDVLNITPFADAVVE